MAEPPDPGRKPKSNAGGSNPPPPAPLPRLWRTEPPEEIELDDGPAGKPGRAKPGGEVDGPAPVQAAPLKKKKKKADAPAPAEKRADGTTKIEETPKFDTYEARQRVRWIVGSAMTALFLIVLFVVIRRVRPEPTVIETTGPDPRAQAAAKAKQNQEQEAQALLDNAKLAAKNGRDPAALDLLGKLAKAYPNTPAGVEAMAALDRHRRNLPLLGATPPPPTGPATPPPGSAASVEKPAAPGLPGGTSGPLGPRVPEVAVNANPGNAAAATPAAPVIVAKPLPSGFKAKPGGKLHESGWPLEIVASKDGAEMVLVPGGTFTMGRDDGDAPERPAHQVRLSAYYIDRHEVTQKQFAQFVRETGRVVEGSRPASPARETPDPPAASDDMPAVNVGARDAKAYCVWAGKTLPTEAQWERAARGDDGRIYPWGSTPPNWSPPRAPKQVDAVMSQPTDVSPFGAFDMAGNAWEWTGDIYDSRYFAQFRDTVVRDPKGPAQPRSRPVLVTVKGGSKTFLAFWRDGIKVEQRFPYLGFRGALQAEKPEPTPVAPTGPARAPGGGTMPEPTGDGVVPF